MGAFYYCPLLPTGRQVTGNIDLYEISTGFVCSRPPWADCEHILNLFDSCTQAKQFACSRNKITSFFVRSCLPAGRRQEISISTRSVQVSCVLVRPGRTASTYSTFSIPARKQSSLLALATKSLRSLSARQESNLRPSA